MTRASILSIILIWAVAAGCRRAPSPASPATVPGTYVSDYAGRHSALTLSEDGTHKQVVTQGGKAVANASGTWWLEDGRIHFTKVYIHDPVTGTLRSGSLSTDNPTKSGRIVVSDDLDYAFVRLPNRK